MKQSKQSKPTKQTKTSQIVTLNAQGLKATDIAKRLKVTPNYVYSVLWQSKNKSKKNKKASAAAEVISTPSQPEYDPVNHPKHYTFGGIETLDFIEAKELSYNIGNAVKYLSRSGLKSCDTEIQDLEKARFYVEREITRLKTWKGEAHG